MKKQLMVILFTMLCLYGCGSGAIQNSESPPISENKEVSVEQIDDLLKHTVNVIPLNEVLPSYIHCIDVTSRWEDRVWAPRALSAPGGLINDNEWLWLVYWACNEPERLPGANEPLLSILPEDAFSDIPVLGTIKFEENYASRSRIIGRYVVNITKDDFQPDISYFYSLCGSLQQHYNENIEYIAGEHEFFDEVLFLRNGVPYPGLPTQPDGCFQYLAGRCTVDEIAEMRQEAAFPEENFKAYAPQWLKYTEASNDFWVDFGETYELLFPAYFDTGNAITSELQMLLNSRLYFQSDMPCTYVDGQLDNEIIAYAMIGVSMQYNPVDELDGFAKFLYDEYRCDIFVPEEHVDEVAHRWFGENVVIDSLKTPRLYDIDWLYDYNLGVFMPPRRGSGVSLVFWRVVSYTIENNIYDVQAVSAFSTNLMADDEFNEQRLERLQQFYTLPAEAEILIERREDGSLFIKQYKTLI